MPRAATVTPSPPPVDVDKLSDDELRAMVEETEQRNRVLLSSVEQKAATIRRLKDGVRESIEATEREEERMANALNRRLDSLRLEQNSLKHHLQSEHNSVVALEEKLRRVVGENASLHESLVEEERGIVKQLRRQIDMVARQKQELEDKLTLEVADVQRHVARLGGGASSGDSPSSRSSSVAGSSSSPLLGIRTTSGNNTVPSETDGARQTPSSASRTQGTSGVVASLASDSGMLRLLSQEAERLRGLETDLSQKHVEYRSRIANLETRMDVAQLEREVQRVAADRLRSQLAQTVSLTRELVANHELLAEWQTEREIMTHAREAQHRERSVSVASEANESLADVSRGDMPGDADTPSLCVRHTPYSDAPPSVLHGTPRVTGALSASLRARNEKASPTAPPS